MYCGRWQIFLRCAAEIVEGKTWVWKFDFWCSGEREIELEGYQLPDSFPSLRGPAVFYYDYLLTFGTEVSRYRGTRLTWASFLFYLNRYVSLFGTIPVILQFFWEADSSDKSKLPGLRNLSPGFLHLRSVHYSHHSDMRTNALFGSRLVLGFMLCCTLVVFGVAIGMAASTHFSRPPAQMYPRIGCAASMPLELSQRAGWSWIGFIVFDLMILVLTTYKGCKVCRASCRGMRRPNLITTLVRDGALYFLVVAGAHSANIIAHLIAGPYERGIGSVLTIVLSTTMISRLMLNIRDPKLTSHLDITRNSLAKETRSSTIYESTLQMTTVFPYYGTGFSATQDDYWYHSRS
ncbi:hypothetical protein R3P38DRAFT_3238095 [Favolaschia claudopus]|uniref:DUF6533 domain-containing protein n=1 Tax=Favolaschia claudopus TaxID=2862362 RepID=A0AAV9ZAS9_9AGAR